ncbi:MAG TPA: DUF559 domain-containing protein [Actinoplanes sp.]|nr:DUF559 domain-containing protein [Actinoplanes sp.]
MQTPRSIAAHAGVTELLVRQDGVISLAQALAATTEKAIRHRVTSGRWQRVYRAVFVTHSGVITAAQQRWAAVLAVGDHAVLAGPTAAQAGGLRHPCATIHLLLPADRKLDWSPTGVAVHRSSVLDERDLLAIGRPPRTKMARSLIDAAQWARCDDDARAVLAAGFQQRLVNAASVLEVLDRLPRAHRRGLIRQTVLDAAGGSHSLAELDFLKLCRVNGLPEPSRQVVRCDAAGRRRYLDAFFDQWRVHVEVDGSQHWDPRQAWSDMYRQNELWIAGDRVLRFPAWALRNDPAAVAAQVRAALRAAGWRG